MKNKRSKEETDNRKKRLSEGSVRERPRERGRERKQSHIEEERNGEAERKRKRTVDKE